MNSENKDDVLIIEIPIKKENKEQIEKDKNFNCDKCNFHTNDSYEWNRHKKTVKHVSSKEEYKQYLIELGLNKVKNATNLELFVYNSLSKTNKFNYIKHIGSTGNKFDIIYILNIKPEHLM